MKAIPKLRKHKSDMIIKNGFNKIIASPCFPSHIDWSKSQYSNKIHGLESWEFNNKGKVYLC